VWRPAAGLRSVGRPQQRRRGSTWPPGSGKQSRNLHNRPNATGSRDAPTDVPRSRRRGGDRDTHPIRPDRHPDKSSLNRGTPGTLSDNSWSPNGRAAHARQSSPANRLLARRRPKSASNQPSSAPRRRFCTSFPQFITRSDAQKWKRNPGQSRKNFESRCTIAALSLGQASRMANKITGPPIIVEPVDGSYDSKNRSQLKIVWTANVQTRSEVVSVDERPRPSLVLRALR
jgi:hypothetical protein